MTERGGPTTQAGIRYQNSIAALYLGELLQLHAPSAREQISEVRIEAPADVDDIVVRFADRHRDWVQVKLTLSATGTAWRKLWRDFYLQSTFMDFGTEDRLVLVIGDHNTLAANLRECAERTLSSSDCSEWHERLTDPQKTVASDVAKVISKKKTLEPAFVLFKRMRVEIIRDRDLERDFAPARLPSTSVGTRHLLSALRDLAGGEARIRGIFRAPQLRQQLLETHAIKIDDPLDWGLAAYISTVEKTSTIRVPGTAFGGPADRIFIWPQIRHAEESSDFEDEQTVRRRETTNDAADLSSYPSDRLSQCIVYAGPGFGKSALLQAISQKLAHGIRVPALVSLSALAEADIEVIDYLSTMLNAEFKVAINWIRLCEQGLAVVLLDGLDEVPTEHRQSVITRFERFTARFPMCPWLLTVRDLAVVPAGFDAPKLELLPLSDSEVIAFVDAWGTLIAGDSGWDFVRRVEAYPDLARLIRIPLFLSILLATWQPDQPLPKGRGDLIEVYLKTLFRPEEHKVTPRAADPEQLRLITEDLAFRLLEVGTIGAGERQVRAVVAQYATATISAERLFDDLLRCGILRRQGGVRISFPFPIVQEYLAARRLVSVNVDEVASRAQHAAERPWAQVIQFALEMLADASEIVRALLAKPDDAFATTARLVGRCILNGMSCHPDLRLEAGRRLAAAWTLASHSSRGRIGQLLADGWANPLLPEVRQKLFDWRLVHDGAGVILTVLGDNDLTEAVLVKYVQRLKHLGNLGPLQPAVSKLGDRAFNLYAEVARTRELDIDEVYSLSFLIRNLDPTRLDHAHVAALADDGQVAASIRMAAAELLGIAPNEAIWGLIDAALLADNYLLRWPALHALKCATDVEQRIVGFLRRGDLSVATKLAIVDHISILLPDKAVLLRFALAQAENERLESLYRHRLRVIAASLGDLATMRALVSEFGTLPADVVSATLLLFGLHRSRELGATAVDKLRARNWEGPEIAKLGHSLLTGATYIAEMQSFGNAALHSGPPHPAFDLFVAQIDEWRNAHNFETHDQVSIETAASSAGFTGATASLHALITRVVRDCDIGDYDNPLNNPVRSAVDELRAKRHLLDLEVAIHLAETSSSNARIGALYMIAAHASRAALEYLVDRYSISDDYRSIIFEKIEQLSSRLGLTVARDGMILRVDAEPAHSGTNLKSSSV